MQRFRNDEQICHAMAGIRSDLGDHVDDVVDRTKQLTDWRHYVREYPWVCVGLATAVGYLIVPKRSEIVSPDANDLAKLAEQNRLVVEKQPKANSKERAAMSAMSFLGNLLLRTAIGYAGQHIGQLASTSQSSDTHDTTAEFKPSRPR